MRHRAEVIERPNLHGGQLHRSASKMRICAAVVAESPIIIGRRKRGENTSIYHHAGNYFCLDNSIVDMGT